MNKPFLFGVVFAALSTYVSGASNTLDPSLKSELNLTLTTTQKGRPQEKENVGVKLFYTDGILTKVTVIINSDAALEEKSTIYDSTLTDQDLSTLIFKKLTAKKKLKHPIDLAGIYNLLKETIEKYEDRKVYADQKSKKKKPTKKK